MRVDPRFLTSEGPELFNGNELLLKGALEIEGGVHLLGGYPGSPNAPFFNAMAQIKDLLVERGIYAVMNNNEALAAAMLNGSQTLPCRSIIAVKSVGVHVAADALALGNLGGAHPEGGAMVVYGDDPWSDSTQVPADSRYISKHLFIPVIEPSNPQEVKDFVDLSMKLSRRSELFCGYIVPTNLADGGGSVTCSPNQYPSFGTSKKLDLKTALIDLDKRVLLPPRSWWQEESFTERHATAAAVARELGINRLDYPATGGKSPIGFVTSGMAQGYLIHALWEMGVLEEFPILKLGMSYPMDPLLIRELGSQCERIVVIEERRGFMEEQISDILTRQRQAGQADANLELWGKDFPAGLEGIPATRGLHPSILIDRLAPLLKHVQGMAIFTAATAEPPPPAPADEKALDQETEIIDSTARVEVGELPFRIATFCPGCPHRDSASLCLEIKKRFMDAEYMGHRHKRGPVDLLFHGDTGCYTMLMFPPNSQLMHDYSGMGLGGGTGSGIDPFVNNKEVVFMGDGTFFHSGQLAISQAIKIGQDITFIILDNSTTAMTGHQPTSGVDYDIVGNPTPVQDIEEVVAGFTGTSNLMVVRADPEKRKEYNQLLEDTFLADGVKVVIATKECGITQGRRNRRKERAIRKDLGYLPRQKHMNVNEEACRFCLACAEMTGCPGLKHVETDYGRKIQTDISWCVDDGACERIGACSSFEQVTIHRKRPPRSRVPELGLDKIPEPQKRPVGDLWRCCLTGVGGMGLGVGTSVVVRAGHKEGYEVLFLDKKGLAIRNGGTVSQVAYNIAKKPITALIPYGKADLLLGIDVLEAARALDPQGRMRVATKERTAAVINTDKINTISGLMGREDFDPMKLEKLIRNYTRSDDYLARDISRICETYLGSKLYANIMMLGFAFQKGLIPVSMHSMAWAIKDTISTDFRKNLYAFNMGRKLVVDPDLFQGPPQRTDWRDTLEEKCRHTIRRYRQGQQKANELRELVAGTIASVVELSDALKRAIVIRMYDCMRWGGLEYAKRYAKGILDAYLKDRDSYGYAVSEAVVYNLATAMLIKDGVYLAELSTSPEKYARDRKKYNVNPANGDRITYRHLWNWSLRVGGWSMHFRTGVYDWMLKILKRSGWLRKVIPGWHATKHKYLASYERCIAAFTHTSPQQYAQQLRVLEGAQCMNCMNPRCQEAGCPLDSTVSQWMQLVYQDRWHEASDTLHAANNFPEFTSEICPALCQDACKKRFSGFPVQAQQTEKEIIERAFAEGWVTPQIATSKTNRRVAIVGSGPAGLACAQQLVRAGHAVTVFEKDDKVGGLLRYGIPDFRLDKMLIDRRMEQLRQEGVTVRTGAKVGEDVSAEELLRDFDAVCLATGAGRPKELNVPGRGQGGIHPAMDLLRQQNLRTAGATVPDDQAVFARDKVVVVIGGGDTGTDCVETALLQGAKEVHQLEILPRPSEQVEEIPGHEGQVHKRWSVKTLAFVGSNGNVEELSAMSVNWISTPDGPRMQDAPGSEFRIKVDMVLLATGFDAAVEKPLADQFALATDESGRPAVREYQTSVDGVFCAGDLETGPSYVATAIDSGRKAAEKIDSYLADLPKGDQG